MLFDQSFSLLCLQALTSAEVEESQWVAITDLT